MSWSVQFIGKSVNVSKSLEDYSNKLSGDSKAEYDGVKDSLIALVNANNSLNKEYVISISASGHAYKTTEETFSNCNVEIKNLGILV
jgi:hypothetical protein